MKREDKKWQAESDASTLTDVQGILADDKRRKRALDEVSRRATLAVKVNQKLRKVFGK